MFNSKPSVRSCKEVIFLSQADLKLLTKLNSSSLIPLLLASFESAGNKISLQ